MRKHRSYYLLTGLLMFLVVLLVSPLQPQAAVKTLKPDKTYSIDLNGGTNLKFMPAWG